MKHAVWLAVAMLASAPVAAAVAQDDDGFALGAYGGLTNWDATIEGADSDLGESGMNLGVMARFTVPLGGDMYAGAQASLSLMEGAEWNQGGSLRVGQATVTATLEGEIERSADLLAIFGIRAGDGLAYYVGAGLAQASGAISYSGSYVSGDDVLSVSGSESATHTGYKLALGLDMSLDDDIGMIVQFDYADYGEADYGALPIDMTAMGLRLGGLYRF